MPYPLSSLGRQLQDLLHNSKQDLKSFSDPALLQQAVLAFLKNEVDADLMAQYFRFVAMAELQFGSGDSAQTFRGSYAQALLDSAKYPGVAQLTKAAQKVQADYLSHLSRGSFASQLEAEALRDALLKAGLPFSIAYYDRAPKTAAQRLVEQSPLAESLATLQFINNASNTHWEPATVKTGASGRGSNCLFYSFLAELKAQKSVLAARFPSLSVPVAPVAPAVEATSTESIAAPRQKPVSRTRVSLAPSKPAAKVPVQQGSRLFNRNSKPVVSQPKRQAIGKVKLAMADSALITSTSSLERLLLSIDDKSAGQAAERSRLARLAETPIGRTQLIQMDLDRLLALQLANTGQFKSMDVWAEAKRIIAAEDAVQANAAVQRVVSSGEMPGRLVSCAA